MLFINPGGFLVTQHIIPFSQSLSSPQSTNTSTVLHPKVTFTRESAAMAAGILRVIGPGYTRPVPGPAYSPFPISV